MKSLPDPKTDEKITSSSTGKARMKTTASRSRLNSFSSITVRDKAIRATLGAWIDSGAKGP